jgi:tetratricopeptide (TPR) repeat protein
MPYKNSNKSLRAIASELGVDAIVEGSVLKAGDRVRITAQLIDAMKDRHLWAKSYEREVRDVLTLQSAVARDIAGEIQLQLSPQETALMMRKRPMNPKAYELYLKGRYEWNRITPQSVRKGLEYYEKALALDPGDARYSAGLADAYLILTQIMGEMPPQEGMKKVKEYARRALAADDSSAEAHTSMAAGLLFGDWNWAEAAREARIAEAARDVDIQPESLLTHALAAWALGDAHKALRLIQRARRIDPISEDIVLHEASFLLYTGQAEEAARRCISVIDTHADPSAPYFRLSEVRRAQGRFDEAIEAIRKAHALNGDSDEELDAALAEATGKEGYARIEATAVLRLELPALRRRRARHDYASPLDFARAYAQLGDSDKAFDYMDQALEERSPGLVMLNVDRAWDQIRADPRFKAAVRRVGLPS